MIHRTEATWQTPGWQQQLATAFRSVEDLFEYLELDSDRLPAAEAAARDFPLCVPRGYAARIEKGRLQDPLLRQVLPTGDELTRDPGYSIDPLGDRANSAVRGTLHKYRHRVLLVTTGACGIHCRYCFRRHYPYSASSAGRDNWTQALDYLRETSDIREVILSGGDPLTLSDTRLERLAQALGEIPHIQRLRIHTRLPLLIPERITDDLIHWFTQGRLQPVLVLHTNHPQELSAELTAAIKPLRHRGVTILNQSVLLKGVNDSTAALTVLSETLFSAGILPYYLHLLDRVQGAAHFEVPEPGALALYRHLRELLPGYLVPRMVRDEATSKAKTLVI